MGEDKNKSDALTPFNDDTASKELKELLDEVPDEFLIDAIKERNKGQPQSEIAKTVSIAAISQQSYSGPIPPPDMLKEYESTHQGLADRIVSMAEQEQAHRHNREETALKGEISKDTRGQNYALFVSLTIIIGSIILMLYGQPIAAITGTALSGATLTTLAYIFISGRKPSKEK